MHLSSLGERGLNTFTEQDTHSCILIIGRAIAFLWHQVKIVALDVQLVEKNKYPCVLLQSNSEVWQGYSMVSQPYQVTLFLEKSSHGLLVVHLNTVIIPSASIKDGDMPTNWPITLPREEPISNSEGTSPPCKPASNEALVKNNFNTGSRHSEVPLKALSVIQRLIPSYFLSENTIINNTTIAVPMKVRNL